MRTGTGLALIALGAILAFAVTGHPSFLNIQVVGWVIMLTGVAGMVVPRRGYGWLRRRLVLRRGPDGQVVSRTGQSRYWPYRMLNPGSTTLDTGTEAPITSDPPTIEGEPAEEVIEEFRQE